MPEGSFAEPLKIANYQTANAAKPFFIGWSSSNAKILTKPAFRFATIAAFGVLALAFIFTYSQQKISKFQIDYDHSKQVEGWLMDSPVPMLHTIAGKDANGNPIFKSILLVDGLKHGAKELVAQALKNGNGNNYVKIEGYATDRQYISCGPVDAHTPMCEGGGSGAPNYPIMEIANGISSITAAPAPIAMPSENLDAGKTIEIVGEIIDPKCYFGAMNPGEGKAHRSCAIRCISGGIMPCIKYILNGQKHYAVLVGKNGEVMNQTVLPFVGEPATINGRLAKMDNWELLYVDGQIKRCNK